MQILRSSIIFCLLYCTVFAMEEEEEVEIFRLSISVTSVHTSEYWCTSRTTEPTTSGVPINF